ncbi:MAG: toll/interleukin-1 receptor domain-containing protein [Planctomycetota bacterium]
MERLEALELLRRGQAGIEAWNRRREHGEDVPFLTAADLRGADLRGADLRFASLALARLDEADLSYADLSGASLRRADLYKGNLEGANLKNAEFRVADLSNACLNSADLQFADFSGADLASAQLTNARLTGANFARTQLEKADLRDANLREALLIGARMHGADLSGAVFGSTVISCSLAGVRHLNETIHHTPSPIAISSILTIDQSESPMAFLRGCGLRDEEIQHFLKMLGQAVRFDACFISYQSNDEALAARLHQDLQAAGIRCWRRDHESAHETSPAFELDYTNLGVGKLVVIASQASLNCVPVKRDILWALERENGRLIQRVDGHTNSNDDDGQHESSNDGHARTQASPTSGFDVGIGGPSHADPSKSNPESSSDHSAGSANSGLNAKVLLPVQVDDFLTNGWEDELARRCRDRERIDARGWQHDATVYTALRDRLISELKQ